MFLPLPRPPRFPEPRGGGGCVLADVTGRRFCLPEGGGGGDLTDDGSVLFVCSKGWKRLRRLSSP